MSEELYQKTIVHLATRLAQVEEENERNKNSASYWLSEFSRVSKELEGQSDTCRE